MPRTTLFRISKKEQYIPTILAGLRKTVAQEALKKLSPDHRIELDKNAKHLAVIKGVQYETALDILQALGIFFCQEGMYGPKKTIRTKTD